MGNIDSKNKFIEESFSNHIKEMQVKKKLNNKT